jgi:energy-coupling factor transporter transmembrane protein EcfT
VLIDEASRIVNARAARSFGQKGLGIAVFNHILSSLFMRTDDRAECIYTAMRCRGFNNGSIVTLTKLQWGYKETIFLGTWTLLFVIFKYRILFL